MIDRRDTLRLGLLALALTGGVGGLAACSSDDEPGLQPAPDADPDGIELVSSDVKRAAGDTTALAPVVDGLRLLAGDLYRELATEPGNLVLSPYSVAVALGMTLVGAAGRTAREMGEVLHTGDLGDRWHKGLNAVTSGTGALAGERKRADGSKATIELATANQLFGQQGVGWEADFLDLLAKEYGAGLRAVDYETAPEDARTLINDWVEQQTHDRIVDLVPEGLIDPSTRLVLVNAIYLKAPWEQPFEKTLTAAGDFHRLDGSTVAADLMRRPDIKGGWVTGDGFRAAVLPYAGGGLSMSVVVPDDGQLAAVEGALAKSGYGPVLASSAAPATIDLTLPRWSFRTAAPLKEALRTMGMPTAFADGADFSPMTDEDLDLVIADVVHQGFIAVDEEGTEASAATAVVMAETAAPVAEVLVADRPFLFLIHDTEHGTPLFVGRVTDPTAE
ncbi:serpin B [Nocardioides aromaticivorans]|uniref:Serpin B n=1 Tax=Nocardioides aromaticivorans TaxID=200618 RepID=A0A7Y9ZIW2_9ACTN|nr:serpin family protein [Nocardioides aromaticivorans]NYI46279.1 serpin B [Nocardioides aromaticivorans]